MGVQGEKGTGMSQDEKQRRAPVLDPIDRVSEIIFGLIMALSFTGAVSAATAAVSTPCTVTWSAWICQPAKGVPSYSMVSL